MSTSSNLISDFNLLDFFTAVDAARLPRYQEWSNGVIIGETPWEQKVESAGVSTLATGDLNNDGFDDVLVSIGDTKLPYPVVLLSRGDGTFKQETRFDGPSAVRTLREAQIIDMNNDGYKDIVTFPAPHGWKVEVQGLE